MPRAILAPPTQQAAERSYPASALLNPPGRDESCACVPRRYWCWSAALCLAATPASAQYGAKPMSDPATGESYHVEIGGYLWFPTPDILISSEALGIVGSQIDFVSDLGIEKTKFRQLKTVSASWAEAQAPFRIHPNHL